MSTLRRRSTALVLAALTAGVLIGAASPGAAMTTAGGIRIENDECIPYDHFKCPREPVG